MIQNVDPSPAFHKITQNCAYDTLAYSKAETYM